MDVGQYEAAMGEALGALGVPLPDQTSAELFASDPARLAVLAKVDARRWALGQSFVVVTAEGLAATE
jgi:hypothetical protein